MLSLYGEFPRILGQVVLIILQIGNRAIWVLFFQIFSCCHLFSPGNFCQYIPVACCLHNVEVVLFTNLEKIFFPITEVIYRKVS